jgi:hypothetical protein
LSDFSSKNTAIDIREQTRATVEAGAKLEGQLIAGESELDSLRHIYGNQNVRVRAAEARNAILQRELQRANGQSLTDLDGKDTDASHHIQPCGNFLSWEFVGLISIEMSAYMRRFSTCFRRNMRLHVLKK